MAKGKKQRNAYKPKKPVAKDALTSGVNSDIKDLQRRMGDSISALRAEVKNGNQEQAARATRALAELRGFRKVRGMQAVSNSKEAAAVLKAIEQHQVKTQGVVQKSRKTKGNDGLTMTERMRKENQEIETKDNIVKTLRRIAEDQQERDEAERESNRLLSANVRTQLRQGLSAFLGPAGPLIETFVELKDAYGDDAKALMKRVGRWWKTDKDLLTTHDKETARRDLQDKRWWNRMSGSLKKMVSGFGGGGWISRLLDATGISRVLKTVLGTVKGLGKAIGKGLSKLLGKGGKFLGKAGKLLGGAGKLAGRAVPFLGAAIGAYDLATKGEADKDESKLSKAGDYASGALSGASIGALFGGPIGAAVGAVLGTAFTGIMRNRESIMTKLTGAWDKVTSIAGSAYETVVKYGRGISAFFGSIIDDLRDGVGSLVKWLDTNVPGFESLRGWVGDTAGKAADAVKEAAPAIGGAIKDSVLNSPVVQVGKIMGKAVGSVASTVGGVVSDATGAAANALEDAPKGSIAAGLGGAAAAVSKATATDTKPKSIPTGSAATLPTTSKGLGDMANGIKPPKDLHQPSSEVKDAILGAADTHGVDKGYMMAMAAQESSFRPGAKADTSSASGLYQFIDGTWKGMVNKYGKATGIGMGDRMDPKANATMAALFAKDNAARLEKQGHEVTSASMYASHMLGGGGANTLLSARSKNLNASAAEALPRAARANRNVFYNKDGSSKSVDEVYKFFETKIGVKADQYNAQLAKEESGNKTMLASRESSPLARVGSGSSADNVSADTSTPAETVSVAPSVEPYKQASSKGNDVVVDSPSDGRSGGKTQAASAQHASGGRSGSNVQTAGNDVPFVLGDNHMIVINAGMMGA